MKLASGKEVSGMYGTMNQVHPRNVSDHYDDDYMDGLDAIKKTVLTHYSSNPIAPGPYKGIVLKRLDPKPSNSGGLLSFLMFWEEDVELGPQYIIRVPELDSHIPEPQNLEATEGKDLAIIQSHNIYKAESQTVGTETAEVGEIVWVNIKNGEYIYLGKLKDEATPPVGAGGAGGGGSSGPPGVALAPDGTPIITDSNIPSNYTPPKYGEILKHGGRRKHGFLGNEFSQWSSQVRSRGYAPPTSATTPKPNIVKHQNWDLSPRMHLYKGDNSYLVTGLTAFNDKYPPKPRKKGQRGTVYTKGRSSREDWLHIISEVKTIINGLGGGFYLGSFKAWIYNATSRGPLFSMHSNGTASDFHAGTVVNHGGSLKKYEASIEVQQNRAHWVQWLKMPKEAKFQYAGRTWEAKKVRINAVRLPWGGQAHNYRTPMEGIYFNMAECWEYFGAKGIPPWYQHTFWKTQTDKWDESWHFDSRLTNGYVRNKTRVKDGVYAQNFRGGYTTPARKETLGIMKSTARDVRWGGGAFTVGRPPKGQR